MPDWQFAFGGFFTLWGVMAFLRIVTRELHRQAVDLETERHRREEQARREALLPVATATPITLESPLNGT